MKQKLISFIIFSVFAAVVLSGSCSAATTDRTVTVSASATKPLTPGPLLDDFGHGAPINVWNASTGAFAGALDVDGNPIDPDPNTKCEASYIDDPGTENDRVAGNCLKLTYNVNAANNYSGYYSRLYSTLPSQDLSGYTALSFYIKGGSGGEFFKIQLKRGDGIIANLYITDYLDDGVTTGWRKVTIPFHNFVNLGNVSSWGDMAEFIIVFEQYSCDINDNSPKTGTVYIDDIKFENINIPVVRIDHFGDKLGAIALGGNMGTGVDDGAPANLNKYSFSGASGEYDPEGHPNGLKLEYDVTSGFAYTFLIFGGGGMGWTATPHDFSEYVTLSFSVKGKSSTENPKTMKIELADSGGTKSFVIAGITTDWQTYKIPLSSIPLLRKNSLKQITFVLEGWRVGNAGGNKAGTVFIDSIQFE